MRSEDQTYKGYLDSLDRSEFTDAQQHLTKAIHTEAEIDAKRKEKVGGKNAVGSGTSMEITVLTTQGAKSGSPPSQGKHDTYDTLNLRRQSAFGWNSTRC